ncbi:MAG: hypothetical protein HY663_00875, partial [Chloroflexi bacterium]|nr:hypothetical protein [Chloroflexota bacterium]
MILADNSNGTVVLDEIPVNISVGAVLERMKMHNGSARIEKMIQDLIDTVTLVARPKVLYKMSTIDRADGRTVEVDGVEFTHHVPTLGFGEGERVFPYVATCGVEVETIKTPPGDVMRGYCLNIIKNVVLRSAGTYFQDHLKTTYHLEEISRIAPGEAMGTVAQQPKLFSILGDVQGAIGVRMSEHNMMLPEKSNSGIYFETAIK